MKIKRFITAGALVLCVALMSGVSYAWFTEYIQKDIEDINAGYLHITFTGESGETQILRGDGQNLTFPSEDSQTLGYTITNESPIPVIVQFKIGALMAYIMPPESDYMIGDYVNPEYRQFLAKMTPEEKLIDFIPDPNPGSNVVAGVVLTEDNEEDDGWILTGFGSEYLGTDDYGSQYFRLATAGTAVCTFKLGLSSTAGNRYQYALLQLGEATALATQDNEAAFLSTFGVEYDTVFKKVH